MTVIRDQGVTPKYSEKLSTRTSKHMSAVYRCVHCTCAGKLCLNRSMRILNFAHETEIEARRNGAFMLARVVRSLFEVVMKCREWESEHLALIDAHFNTIQELTTPDQDKPPAALMGNVLEESVAPVEAWVDWLEQAGKRLAAEHGSTFECMRRNSPAANCLLVTYCGR